MINNDKKSCKLLINKAFTLIELLAVIVILAIIAVIATPIILGVIDDSKLKAKENSVNGLMEAVNMTYTKSQLSTTPLRLPITATINNGVIMATDGTNNVEVTYTGEKPISGTIKIDGFGGLSASNIKYSDNYTCTKGNGENGCTNSILTLPGMTADNMITGRYYFKGANPNNYIKLKEGANPDILYRIVSIEADGAIKVIRNDVIINMPYDSRSGAGTAESPYIGPRRNEANSYCNYANSYNNYNGCNAWSKVNGIYTNKEAFGTVSTDSEINTYLNQTFYNTLDNSVKEKIVTYLYNITGNDWSSSGVGPDADTLYTNFMNNSTYKTEWSGKIGLLTTRDWFLATANTPTSAKICDPDKAGGLGGGYYNSTIANQASANHATNYGCSDANYLYSTNSFWIMIPNLSNRHLVWHVYSAGYVNYYQAYDILGVRPVFYLSPNTQLTGSGTSADPYKIKS